MTDEFTDFIRYVRAYGAVRLCPQFGIIGAACSDPETLCDQYVFCKRARELQKEPDTLPQWAIDAIENEVGQNLNNRSQLFYCGFVQALNWVLSLRKPEENK